MKLNQLQVVFVSSWLILSVLSQATNNKVKLSSLPRVENLQNTRQESLQNNPTKLHLKNAGVQLISNSEECHDDVISACGKSKYNLNNNFDVLYCLTNNQDNVDLSDECNHYTWSYKLNATTNSKFYNLAKSLCRKPLETFVECSKYTASDGKLIPCLLENKNSINIPACIHFLNKIETIVFSDYRLICDFVSDCKAEIIKLQCGKLNANNVDDEEHVPHSQGEVIKCLEDNFADDEPFSKQCQKQITRLAELSADDYHLDRYLYFRCRQDREKFCEDIPAGQGMVYKCLFNHKFDPQMSQQCHEALTARQKIIAKDYKASYALLRSCKVEITKSKCDNASLHTSKGDGNAVGLSSIMLCLENHSINGIPISPTCDDQLVDFRRMLMEDYELSPEIVHECGEAITQKCESGLKREGKTLHCLMSLAEIDNGLKPKCNDALMDLIKETEVAEDYRMDAVLTRACQPVVDNLCSDYKAGDPMVLSCLMENLYEKQMKKPCQKHLLELQYFVSRDFMIDPNFRTRCSAEAERLCKTPIAGPGAGFGEGENTENNADDSASVPLSVVISCLYRNIHSDLDKKDLKIVGKGLTEECETEVHRILHQRALDFNLNPKLEEKCRLDLGQFCSEQEHEKGSELVCLQDHYKELKSKECKQQIVDLTQLESEDVLDFESMLIKACEPMLQKYCKEFLNDDEGKVMECLISNKDNMEIEACAAGVTHFQLIEMQDYHFNSKFLKACKADVESLCKSEDVKTKADVVKCLSLNVRNSVIANKPSSVSLGCKKQLTVEKLQLHENIKLNPKLEAACHSDYKKLCSDVKEGKAQVIECLREKKENLSPSCYTHLFEVEKEESENPKFDFRLMRTCKSDVKQHCAGTLANGDFSLVMECLLEKKALLVKPCRLLVIKREKEMFSDIELNVDLKKSCEKDINKFCEKELEIAKGLHREESIQAHDPEGIVYSCLKTHFTSSKNQQLSRSCYRHLEFVIKEQEQNYELDPQLTLNCINSITKLCSPEPGSNVVECLKTMYFENKLKNDPKCMVEIARLLTEGRSDIMADPILHQACSVDLTKHCTDIPEGHGRLIECLLSKDKNTLSMECQETLETRNNMWKHAIKTEVKGVRDLSNLVMSSSNSTYFMFMLTVSVMGLILFGLVCGRFTKKISRDRKTR